MSRLIRQGYIQRVDVATGDVIKQSAYSKVSRFTDGSKWSREEASSRFIWYLGRANYAGLEMATDALVRFQAFDSVLKHAMRGSQPNVEKVKVLLRLWNNRGLHAIPRALSNDLFLFTELIDHFVPNYCGSGLTLYRGQSKQRYEQAIYGIAWTSIPRIASIFAGNRDDAGIVLRVEATPDMIICRLGDYISTPKTVEGTGDDYEDEYLIDPRRLAGRVAVAKISQS